MASTEYNAYFLASTWLNSILYTLELVLVWHYFRRPGRPRAHRLGILALLFFDTISSFAVFAEAWILLLRVGNGANQSEQELLAAFRVAFNAAAGSIFATYTTASLEQLFLCYVFYALSKQTIITALLVVPVIVHLGFSYASAGLLITTGSPSGNALTTTKIGGITCAVTDVLIATSLIVVFFRMEAQFGDRQSIRSVLRRLMLLIASSGAMTASNTLVNVILLLKDQPAELLFFSTQGRIYALTILVNFLVGNPAQRPESVFSANVNYPQDGPSSTRNNNAGVVFRVRYSTTREQRDDQGRIADADMEDDPDYVDLDTLPSKRSRIHPGSVDK